MTRQEFMRRLEKLLSDIPENERREAMEYYENYFADAGPENEAKIIQELESPEKVATSIKKDLFGENYETYVYMNRERQQEELRREQNKNKTMRNILLAVVVVLTFPLWVGVVAAAFGILVAALACVFAVALTVVVCVGVFLFVGIAFSGIGVVKIFTGFPALGLIITAIGLILLAIGILGVIAVVWMVAKILPWTIRGIVRLFQKPFRKRKEASL